MEAQYLPGTARTRIQDLMKEKKITQTELAEKAGISVSTLSRFISGRTDTLQQEAIISIAESFNVSTDFLLGTADEPSRKNYELSQLGLSVKAARNLYTGKANSKVVSALLENPRFTELTYLIGHYFDSTLAEGFAAQNQLYSTIISSVLKGSLPPEKFNQAAGEVSGLKAPVYQADLTTIQNMFMSVLKEIKKKQENDLSEIQAITKAQTMQIFENLTKGEDIKKPDITPDKIVSAITESISGTGADAEALDSFGQSLSCLMNSMLQKNTENEGAAGQAEQSDKGRNDG